MIVRALPLAACLFWLACESPFSPVFFVSTLETSLASLAGGLDDVVAGEIPLTMRTALASADDS
jgi:hypothetical protein